MTFTKEQQERLDFLTQERGRLERELSEVSREQASLAFACMMATEHADDVRLASTQAVATLTDGPAFPSSRQTVDIARAKTVLVQVAPDRIVLDDRVTELDLTRGFR